MLKSIIENSISAKTIKKIWTGYCSFEGGLVLVYGYSYTCRAFQGLRHKNELYFRYSFLGEDFKRRRINGYVILENSRVINYIHSSYEKYKSRLTEYLKTCLAEKALIDLKAKISSSPLRMISIFTISVIMVNLILNLILKKPITAWGYLMRGLLIFIGTAGLFCEADWPTVKSNSIFFNQAA